MSTLVTTPDLSHKLVGSQDSDSMHRSNPDSDEGNQKVLSIPNLSNIAQTNDLLHWHQVHTQGSSVFSTDFPDDWLPIVVRGSIH